MYVGLLAQIWDLAKRLCERTVDLYAELFPFRQHFKNNKKQWNNGQSGKLLPETLNTFIGDDFSEIMQQTTVVPCTQSIHPVTNMLKINFQAFLDDEPMVIGYAPPPSNHPLETRIKKEPIKIVRPEFRRIEMTSGTTNSTDIGLPINRATMTDELPLNRITSVEDIQKFVRTEDNNRSVGIHTFTRQLSDTQWRDVRKQINQIIVTSHARLSVKKFKKFWTTTTGTV